MDWDTARRQADSRLPKLLTTNPMNPLDRIAQLTERAENAEKQADMALSNCESAQRDVALLRSQLADARQQLERDSATIAKLAKDKRELMVALRDVPAALRELFEADDDGPLELLRANLDSAMRNAAEVLSRHA